MQDLSGPMQDLSGLVQGLSGPVRSDAGLVRTCQELQGPNVSTPLALLRKEAEIYEENNNLPRL